MKRVGLVVAIVFYLGVLGYVGKASGASVGLLRVTQPHVVERIESELKAINRTLERIAKLLEAKPEPVESPKPPKAIDDNLARDPCHGVTGPTAGFLGCGSAPKPVPAEPPATHPPIPVSDLGWTNGRHFYTDVFAGSTYQHTIDVPPGAATFYVAMRGFHEGGGTIAFTLTDPAGAIVRSSAGMNSGHVGIDVSNPKEGRYTLKFWPSFTGRVLASLVHP